MHNQEYMKKASLLRYSLKANALFSAISGTILTLFAGSLVAAFGFTTPIGPISPALLIQIIGISLILFAVGLYQNSKKNDPNNAEAWLAVIMDELWVIGSVILISLDIYPMALTGKVAIGSVAAIVATFSVLQFLGIRRLKGVAFVK